MEGEIFGGLKLVKLLDKIKYKRRRCICECLTCNTISEYCWSNVIGNNINRCQQCAYKVRAFKTRKSNLKPLLEDNHISYYYHGLIYADGCIYKHHSEILNVLTMELAEQDKYYLEQFAKYLSLSKIHLRHKRYNNCQNHYQIHCGDKDIVPKLANNLGIIGDKTNNPPNPNIFYNMDYEQRLSICVGMIDGDGSRINNNIKVSENGCWINTLSAMYNGLYSSCKIDKENNARCYISKDGVITLLKHIQKYNLPVFDRKWYPIKDRKNG